MLFHYSYPLFKYFDAGVTLCLQAVLGVEVGARHRLAIRLHNLGVRDVAPSSFDPMKAPENPEKGKNCLQIHFYKNLVHFKTLC